MKQQICNAALYCKRDPDRKNRIIPNEETRWIVQKIFEMAAHGMGCAKIQQHLRSEKIPVPSWWRYQVNGQRSEYFDDADENIRYRWSLPSLRKILENETYIGNLVHNKRGRISFKNKRQVDKPLDEWIRVDGAIEPIISRDLWDATQAHINSRKRSTRTGDNLIFAGLLRCLDCGWTLSCGYNKQGRRYSGNPYIVSLSNIKRRD